MKENLNKLFNKIKDSMGPFDERTFEVIQVLEQMEDDIINRYYPSEKEETRSKLEIAKELFSYFAGVLLEKAESENYNGKKISLTEIFQEVLGLFGTEKILIYMAEQRVKVSPLLPFFDGYLKMFVLEFYGKSTLKHHEKIALGNLARQIIYHVHLIVSLPVDSTIEFLLRYIESENAKLQQEVDSIISNIYRQLETTDPYGHAKPSRYVYWPYNFDSLNALHRKLDPFYIESNTCFFDFFNREPLSNESLIEWKGSVRELAYLFIQLYEDEIYKSLKISEFVCNRFLAENKKLTIKTFRPAVSYLKNFKASMLSPELKRILSIAKEVKSIAG